MRIVHLSYDYGLSGTSGGPIAATRLHLALLRAGVDSHFVCVRQLEEGSNVHCLPQGWLMRKLFYFVPRVFWVLSKYATGQLLMPNIWPLPGFSKLMRELRPDVVHIHWIGQDMVSFAQLAALKAKFVYTLHDLTAVNAVEPHPKSDRRFAEGFAKGNSSAAERWMFNRKRRFMEKVQPVFTGPSDWVCGMLHESLLGYDRPVRRVLNIVDPAYRFDASLLWPHEKFTILFGAFGGRASAYKGWPDLEAALKLLPEDVKAGVEVKVFGESAADSDVDGVSVRFLGALSDATAICQAYHEADVFAFPSKWETLGLVKLEALSCGLPVVVFRRAACADGIRHGENGWIAPDGDIAAYAKGIEFFFRKWRRGELNALRPQIAAEAQKDFDEGEILKQMISVYTSVLK